MIKVKTLTIIEVSSYDCQEAVRQYVAKKLSINTTGMSIRFVGNENEIAALVSESERNLVKVY